MDRGVRLAGSYPRIQGMTPQRYGAFTTTIAMGGTILWARVNVPTAEGEERSFSKPTFPVSRPLGDKCFNPELGLEVGNGYVQIMEYDYP